MSIFSFIHDDNSKIPVNDEVINCYLSEIFRNLVIVRELTPSNINKTFSISTGSDEYILKIACKDIKKAQRESTLLQELQPHLPTPELISASVSTIPGHIMMSHSGIRLAKSESTSDYFNFGKIIPRISELSVSKKCRQLLKKNRSEHDIKSSHSYGNPDHPYAHYYRKYKHHHKNYFSHGDLHIHQAMLATNGYISIVDWENASLSYRLLDLSKAVSHCLSVKQPIEFAQAIMDGYKSVDNLKNQEENKLLISLIWYDFNKKYNV